MVEDGSDRKFGISDKSVLKAGVRVVQTSLDNAPRKLPRIEEDEEETEPSKVVDTSGEDTEPVPVTNRQRREKSANKFTRGDY